jgi:hypothetical protein
MKRMLLDVDKIYCSKLWRPDLSVNDTSVDFSDIADLELDIANADLRILETIERNPGRFDDVALLIFDFACIPLARRHEGRRI